MDNLIEIRNLTKYFGVVTALDNVNLDFPKGSIIGLLGPNGSGKTTLIKIITDLIMQYKGSVLVNGFKPGIESKACVAYLPDRNILSDKWNANYAVEYFADFFPDFDAEKARNLINKLGIDPTRKFKALSKGTKEKLQLILVLSRRVKLYIFDEPIAGVDPAARDLIFQLILNYRSPDSSLIISTHLVSEVEDILDYVVFLKEGKVSFSGTKSELEVSHDNKSINEIFKEVYRHAQIVEA